MTYGSVTHGLDAPPILVSPLKLGKLVPGLK
jgi:hypothetical protein